MDAASNNSVDNIRDIREEVEFIPTSAKYRVYIIDEVHMLSTGAFNALLKTLEEPPAHVVFILATTEPQKLPATILSRCQRFDFKRISADDITKRLKFICDSINIKIEENALKIISDLADGAMRDAISILDRCVSDGDEIITENKIRELSGVPQFEFLKDMTNAIIEGNPSEILNISRRLCDAGKDINVFLWELIKFERDIAMYDIDGALYKYNEEEMNTIKELFSKAEKSVFLNLISKLSELQNSIKWSQEQRVMFEAGLVKICLEENKPQTSYQMVNVAESKDTNILLNKNVSIDDINSNLGTKVLTILKENEKIRLHADLLTTKIELQEDGIVHIIFSNNLVQTTKANFQKEETKIAIKSAVAKALGKEVSVKYDNFR